MTNWTDFFYNQTGYFVNIAKFLQNTIDSSNCDVVISSAVASTIPATHRWIENERIKDLNSIHLEYLNKHLPFPSTHNQLLTSFPRNYSWILFFFELFKLFWSQTLVKLLEFYEYRDNWKDRKLEKWVFYRGGIILDRWIVL